MWLILSSQKPIRQNHHASNAAVYPLSSHLFTSHSYVIRVRSPLSQTSSSITSRSRSQRIHHNRHRSYKSLTKYTMFSLSLSLSLSYTLEGSYRIAHYIAALTNHSHALSFTTHTHLRSIRRSQTSSARLSCTQARTFSHYYSLSLFLSTSARLSLLTHTSSRQANVASP